MDKYRDAKHRVIYLALGNDPKGLIFGLVFTKIFE